MKSVPIVAFGREIYVAVGHSEVMPEVPFEFWNYGNSEDRNLPTMVMSDPDEIEEVSNEFLVFRRLEPGSAEHANAMAILRSILNESGG